MWKVGGRHKLADSPVSLCWAMFPSEEGFLRTPDNNYNSTLLSAVLLNPPSITLDTTCLPAEQSERIIFSLSQMLRLFQEKIFFFHNMLMRHVSKDVVKSAIFIVASSSQLLKSVIKECLSITSVRFEGVEIPELLHGQQLLLELILKHEVDQ